MAVHSRSLRVSERQVPQGEAHEPSPLFRVFGAFQRCYRKVRAGVLGEDKMA